MLLVPDGALALGLGTALALGAAAVVLLPLVREAEPDEPDARAVGPARPDQASAVEALREIEFDRATGKLSDADYAALKASYTREALAELRARDAALASAPVATGPAADAPGEDAVEAALRAYRTQAPRCAVHGARPEGDARFCSECGGFLRRACPRCGAACEGEGQRFCGECGSALAAAA